MSLNGTTINITSQCQIIWYQWKSDTTPISDPVADSAESIGYDLSNHLMESCSFSKNLGTPAGNFSFHLDASRDWKDLVKPGSWCLIYMSNDGSLQMPGPESNEVLPNPPSNLKAQRKNLRAICYIERVATVGNVDERGAVNISYEISGRDYGVIYEETELWYNFFVFDELKIAGLSAYLDRQNENTAADLLAVVHDLFFAAERRIKSEALGPNNSLTSIGQQWLLPKQMASALDLSFTSSRTFFGEIDGLQDFKKTLVTSLIDTPLKFINGKVWDKLRTLSTPGLHELFPELDDTGFPRLVFRPIPWGIDQSAYQKIASQGIIPLYSELAANSDLVIEDAVEIINFNLGEDNHARYNHFFLKVENDIIIMESTINILNNRKSSADRSFPFMDQLSVQRHGFRPMHLSINSLPDKLVTKTGDNKDGFPNSDLLLEYNEVLFDYWQNSVNFESGAITIVGRPEVRVGKTLNFGPNIPHNADKIFYIESYSDDFTIDDKGATMWTQTLQVTRGVEKSVLQSLTGFGHRTSQSKPVTGEFTNKG